MKLTTNTTYSSGFTLIELLIAVLIIGVLAAVAVPQYQQAVLKSRYKTLMLPTKSINSGNEVYYLSHGYYADRLKELDVDFNSEDEKTLVKLSDDLEYAYVLSTRSDIDNNYIMYQKHSMNYPGEIHCEALTDDDKANKLCKLLGGEEIAGSQTSGYTTYVLEGTGNGVASGTNIAEECKSSVEKGYSCRITTNQEGKQVKQVCTNGVCRTTTYDEKGGYTNVTCKANSEGVCTSDWRSITYDENGKQISVRSCGTVAADGSCSEYSSGSDYTYDVAGNETGQFNCQTIENDGHCSAYSNAWKYSYDENGNRISMWACNSVAADGSCPRSGLLESNNWKYTYDDNGNQTSQRRCETLSTDGNCGVYYNDRDAYDYTYDANGNRTGQRTCSSVNSDGICTAYSRGIDYTYDDNGNQTSYRSCSSVNAAGVCTAYSGGEDYTYDTSGNKTSDLSCATIESDGSCSSYSKRWDYSYDNNGNRTSTLICNTDSNGTCMEYTYGVNYIFDENGKGILHQYCSGSNINATTGECTTYDTLVSNY